MGKWDAHHGTIKRLFNAGKTDAEIGAEVGGSTKAMEHVRAGLGLFRERAGGTPGVTTAEYTEAETSVVVAGVDQGLTDAQIAASLEGRTEAGVKAFRQFYGIAKTLRPPQSFPDQVRDGYEAGDSDAVIAERIGAVSIHQVKRERLRQGLSRARIWPKRQDTQLKALASRGLTKREIAAKMGLRFSQVQRRLARLQEAERSRSSL